MESGDKTISWAEVLKTHRTQTAVQFQNNRVFSIICSPEQNKLVGDRKIVYSIPNKKQYLKLIAGMKPCIGSTEPVNFFIKKDKNVWIDAGFYNLTSLIESNSHMDFVFEK